MGVLSGLSSFLFGVDPVSDEFVKQQQALQQQQADEYRKREAQQTAAQNAYISSLWGVVNGSAPSAAQRQLGANVDQIQRGYNSMSAGAEGNNAGIMRYGAMLGAGDAMAGANQAAGIQQAQEIANAQGQIGNAYANQAGRSAGLYGTAAGIGRDYAGLAAQIQMANQKADAAAQGTLLSTAGTLGAAAIGGPAAAPIAAAVAPSVAAGIAGGPAPQLQQPAPTGYQSYSSTPGYNPSAYAAPATNPAGSGYSPYDYGNGGRATGGY